MKPAALESCNERYLLSYGGDEMTEPEPPLYALCAEEVWDAPNGTVNGLARQCSRHRGHGPDQSYCKQHACMHADRPYIKDLFGRQDV